MQYMVLAHDGNEYGPADIPTLKQWVTENRLERTSKLRDFQTGQVVLAGSLQDLFPAQGGVATATATAAAPPAQGAAPGPWANPPSPYTRQQPMPYQNAYAGRNTGAGDIWGSIIRSVLALILFFVLNGIGLIVGGYGLYYAIRAQANGHKYGWVAIVISSITMIAIVIGWAFRISAAPTH